MSSAARGAVGHGPGMGPAPAPCDDRGCCNAAAGAPPCGPLIRCTQVPAFTNAAQPAFSATGLPHNPGPIDTCNTCLQHEELYKQAIIDTRIDLGKIVDPPALPAVPPSGRSIGARADLCRTCIREEMILYWTRLGTAFPLLAPLANSIHEITLWPAAAAGIGSAQDLCKCNEVAFDIWRLDRCHACRNVLFDALRT